MRLMYSVLVSGGHADFASPLAAQPALASKPHLIATGVDFGAGADGYVLRDGPPGTLSKAIEMVVGGSPWIDSTLAHR